MKKMVYEGKSKIEILEQGTLNGIEFAIISYGTHPCAYVKIPEGHKFASISGLDYMAIDLDVHGGVTFAREISSTSRLGTFLSEGYWLGWDYNHCDDYSGTDLLFDFKLQVGGKKWTTEEIYEDVVKAVNKINEEK